MTEAGAMNSDPAQPSRTKPGELVVFIIRRDAVCAECGKEMGRGSFLRVEQERPLCLDCADLGHLEFLPRGHTAVTRRATKHSPLRAVVVEWSRQDAMDRPSPPTVRAYTLVYGREPRGWPPA